MLLKLLLLDIKNLIFIILPKSFKFSVLIFKNIINTNKKCVTKSAQIKIIYMSLFVIGFMQAVKYSSYKSI